MHPPGKVRAAGAICTAALLIAVCALCCEGQQGPEDRVVATHSGGSFALENRAIKAEVSTEGGRLGGFSVTDRLHGAELPIEMPFELLLKNGGIYSPGNLQMTGAPTLRALEPHSDASRLAERIHGEEVDVPLETADHLLQVTWSLILLDGSTYVRQILTLTAGQEDVPIQRVQLIDVPLAEARVTGL